MTTIFIICAAVGGTVMVLQFIMALVGLGSDGLDVDASVDVPQDFGGDFDVGGGDMDFRSSRTAFPSPRGGSGGAKTSPLPASRRS